MRPEALFPYPGLVLAALSGAASVALIFSNLRLGSITFAQQTLIMTTTLTIIVLLSSHGRQAVSVRVRPGWQALVM